jgi:hypothetical protein
MCLVGQKNLWASIWVTFLSQTHPVALRATVRADSVVPISTEFLARPMNPSQLFHIPNGGLKGIHHSSRKAEMNFSEPRIGCSCNIVLPF